MNPRWSYLAPFILAPLCLLLGESIPKMLALTRAARPRAICRAPARVLATVLLRFWRLRRRSATCFAGWPEYPPRPKRIFEPRGLARCSLAVGTAAATDRRCDPARRTANDQPHFPLHPCRSAQGDGAADQGCGDRRRDHAGRGDRNPGRDALPVSPSSGNASSTSLASCTPLICSKRPIWRARSAKLPSGQLLSRIHSARRNSASRSNARAKTWQSSSMSTVALQESSQWRISSRRS